MPDVICRCLYIYFKMIVRFIILPLPEGGEGILFYHCPSKLCFVAFFSVTVDGRNPIFGHKLHICTPYVGSVFESIRFLLPVCWLCWFVYTWTYMHIFHRIFLSNYSWQQYDIWSQASYRYPISWEALLDPSDSYFLFADFVDFHI